MSRRPDQRLSEDEFAHLMSECDDSLSGAATAYHAEMRAALHELRQLRGRCLCRGAFRCIECLEQLEQMEADGIGDQAVTLNLALAASVDSAARLARALAESLKLQSHYATLLNQHDGGKRMVFASSEEWLARIDDVDEGTKAAAFVWHPAPSCQRCSECVGCDHHWLDNGDFEDEGDPEYECKHCPAKCRAIEDDNGFPIPDNIPRYGDDAGEAAGEPGQ